MSFFTIIMCFLPEDPFNFKPTLGGNCYEEEKNRKKKRKKVK